LEDFIDEEFVVGVSVAELDLGGGFAVDVRVVEVSVGNFVFGEDHFADVARGSFGTDTQVIIQIL
jgi:hypothetical protein